MYSHVYYIVIVMTMKWLMSQDTAVFAVQEAVPAPVAGVVDLQPALLHLRLDLQRDDHHRRAVAGGRADQRLRRLGRRVGLRHLLRLRVLSDLSYSRGASLSISQPSFCSFSLCSPRTI